MLDTVKEKLLDAQLIIKTKVDHQHCHLEIEVFEAAAFLHALLGKAHE